MSSASTLLGRLVISLPGVEVVWVSQTDQSPILYLIDNILLVLCEVDASVCELYNSVSIKLLLSKSDVVILTYHVASTIQDLNPVRKVYEVVAERRHDVRGGVEVC